MPTSDLDELGENKNVLQEDILMGGSYTCFKFNFSSPSNVFHRNQCHALTIKESKIPISNTVR